MLRVKDEEEFLEQAIESIVELVDEVVIVDNGSSDDTPRIISAAAQKYPSKIRAFSYPHQIARYGLEHVELAKTRQGRRSPRFLPTFYNWCVARCSYPYILKWDGDTVATDALAPTLAAFRSSGKQVLVYTGVNLHESRTHFIEGRPLEDMEPRLFYRRFSRYDNSLGYVEALRSPYFSLFQEFSERVTEPLYFHLKFCKRQRFSNMSADLQLQEEQNAKKGSPLPSNLRSQVTRLKL